MLKAFSKDRFHRVSSTKECPDNCHYTGQWLEYHPLGVRKLLARVLMKFEELIWQKFVPLSLLGGPKVCLSSDEFWGPLSAWQKEQSIFYHQCKASLLPLGQKWGHRCCLSLGIIARHVDSGWGPIAHTPPSGVTYIFHTSRWQWWSKGHLEN